MGALWEVLIAGFLLPAFWHGWRWACRLLAAFVAAKLIGGMVGGVKQQFMNIFGGEAHDKDGGKAEV